ncbi:glycosyltransferase [Mycobacterium yunnanensis]|uniref:Glycosyltransferase n=2 Tax=Mycobacterium yunnanensis TaxID=368477 RepID=A0A9X2Z256_9MYCO|nr:glycosyltransferase [Mycobacterium yunnanensis]
MTLRPDLSIMSVNYPPEPTGIAPYTGGLAAGLRRLGYKVAAHVAHPHYPGWAIHDGYGQWNRSEHMGGVTVRRQLHYVPASPRGVRRLLSELSFGLRLFFSLWNRPRVVIAVSPSLFSTAAAVLRIRLTPFRPRLIVWVQDIYTLGLVETGEGSALARRVVRWVESSTLRAADMVVVIHPRFADFVTRDLGVDASAVEVVRNWTHLPPAEPVEKAFAKSVLGWPADVTLAVHTGNMGTKQGLENIVEAARVADNRCASVHFILVGDGGERRALTELARGIERISFVDPLDDAQYRMALFAADVLVVNEKPGVSAMALPSKLTSYFAAGRPVVAATDLGGITASEVAAADAGVVVPAGCPEELLTAVTAISADQAAASRFGSNGRQHRESVLDERVAIDHWSRLVEAALGKGRWVAHEAVLNSAAQQASGEHVRNRGQPRAARNHLH